MSILWLRKILSDSQFEDRFNRRSIEYFHIFGKLIEILITIYIIKFM